ncbi:hypothetical protein [Oceanobacillus sp. FSL H7-0719]|uniref:hypothetical protein n=1 Tax=Oceanobacillus sp. FSL H7-0719 TaxID=2954507 RepID=UPI0032566EB1
MKRIRSKTFKPKPPLFSAIKLIVLCSYLLILSLVSLTSNTAAFITGNIETNGEIVIGSWNERVKENTNETSEIETEDGDTVNTEAETDIIKNQEAEKK